MATEKDFELLDDYLANKLDPKAMADFERRMTTDSSLAQEVSFQTQLVEGI